MSSDQHGNTDKILTQSNYMQVMRLFVDDSQDLLSCLVAGHCQAQITTGSSYVGKNICTYMSHYLAKVTSVQRKEVHI